MSSTAPDPYPTDEERRPGSILRRPGAPPQIRSPPTRSAASDPYPVDQQRHPGDQVRHQGVSTTNTTTQSSTTAASPGTPSMTRTRSQETTRETPLNEYERQREANIEENVRRMQELGINVLTSSLNFSTKTTKARKSSKQCSYNEGSDSSECLPEAEDGIQGGDDTDLDDELVPLAIIESPVTRIKKKVTTKRTRKCSNMAPGGRRSNRVRPNGPAEVAQGVSTRSPVPNMIDEQWCQLVAKWSDTKTKATCDQNKVNRGKVKLPHATGSRCYVAQLHSYNKEAEVREASGELLDEELNAFEAFKICHTSRKKGMSDAAKQAVSTMEMMRMGSHQCQVLRLFPRCSP